MREVRSSQKAILFVHGILETPKFFKPLLPSIPKDWAVYTVLLKGHTGVVKDFSAASMAKWKKQVHKAIKRLTAEHDTVVIAAHSMGTLFAIQESERFPIKALFLMNVPLKIGLKPKLLKIVLNHYTNNFDLNDKVIMASKDSHGLEPDSNVFHYIGWIPRFLELFAEISKTRPLAEKFTVPAYSYFSKNDEMVSLRSAEYLKRNPHVIVNLLRTSWHHYYSPEDLRIMQRDLFNLLRRL